MKNKTSAIFENIYTISTLLCGVFLFGSLFWSAVSGNGVYFVFGYPVAVVLLVVAHWSRSKRANTASSVTGGTVPSK
jgi:hypothetical protein